MNWEEAVKRSWKLTHESPKLYMKGYETGLAASEGFKNSFNTIIFIGMGASGIVGDIITDMITPAMKHPLHTFKDYRIPIPLGRESLVVVLSYSGETSETISAAAEAYTSKASMVAVTSGGVLGEVAVKKGIPLARITDGLVPRFAVPEMVGAVIGLLTGLGLYSEVSRLFKESITRLQVFLSRNPSIDNLNEFSNGLMGRIASVIGHTHLKAVAHRLKAQLSENAKHPAYVTLLPEACHNEVEGWLPEYALASIVIRSGYEPPAISSALNHIEDYLKRNGISYRVLRVESSTYVDEIIRLITLADLLSISLAYAKRVDPFQLNFIPQFRKILGLDGRLVDMALRRFGVEG